MGLRFGTGEGPLLPGVVVFGAGARMIGTLLGAFLELEGHWLGREVLFADDVSMCVLDGRTVAQELPEEGFLHVH